MHDAAVSLSSPQCPPESCSAISSDRTDLSPSISPAQLTAALSAAFTNNGAHGEGRKRSFVSLSTAETCSRSPVRSSSLLVCAGSHSVVIGIRTLGPSPDRCSRPSLSWDHGASRVISHTLARSKSCGESLPRAAAVECAAGGLRSDPSC